VHDSIPADNPACHGVNEFNISEVTADLKIPSCPAISRMPYAVCSNSPTSIRIDEIDAKHNVVVY